MAFYSSSSSALRLFLNKGNVLLVPAVAGLSCQASWSSATSASTGFTSASIVTTQCESNPTKSPASNLRQRMTLIGRFSLQSETLVNPSITSFFMTLSGDPLTPSDLIRLWEERRMSELHPRFLQRVSSDAPGFFESTGDRPLGRFITETLYPSEGSNLRRELQTRIQHLQTSAWDLGDALWHLYIAPWRETRPSLFEESPHQQPQQSHRSLVLFRAHHALADGASLTAALADLFDEAAEFRSQAAAALREYRRKAASEARGWRRRALRLLRLLAGALEAALHHLHLLFLSHWEADPWQVLRDEAGPYSDANKSKLRVASFVDAAAPVGRVKEVARRVAGPKATVNDVWVACVASAVARQLQWHRSRRSALRAETAPPLPPQRYLHVSVPVHLTGGAILPGESLGNKLGAFVVRVPGELEGGAVGASDVRLRASHAELFRWKRSAMPWTSHVLAKALSAASPWLPSGWVAAMYRRASAGSVAVVTNVRGPSKKVHVGGRAVESFHGFVPLPPGIPIGVVVGSYAGQVTLTLTAEPWAVPDGDQFLAWVLEEYLDLLHLASAQAPQQGRGDWIRDPTRAS